MVGHSKVLDEWGDIYHGRDYLHAVQTDRIQKGDTVLLMSLNSAELYESKQSNCWIYMWVVLDLAPDLQYKIYHIAVLMKENLNTWDAVDSIVFKLKPLAHLGTADGPGMQCLNSLTGHSGAYDCRLYCPVKGW